MTRAMVSRGLVCLALVAGLGAGVRGDPIDDYVKSELHARHIAGLALAIDHQGRTTKLAAYGTASVELDAPVTPATVFPIASLTKPFTAAAVLLLVEEGKVSLDAPIHRYIDQPTGSWRDITVRQLLSHTGGVKDYLNELRSVTRDGTSIEEILTYVGRLPLNQPPGDRYGYSNTGYILLDLLIQKVTGKTYDRFLAERIFTPLGMSSTVRNDPDRVIPRRANGYFWKDGELRPSPRLEPTLYDHGDAGLASTVTDLVRWDAALRSDAILSPASRALMETPVKLNDGSPYPHALGWRLGEANGHRLQYHEGNRWDGSSAMLRYLDDDLTVIVLTNLADANPSSLARHVAGLVDPALLPPEARATAEDPHSEVTRCLRDLLLAVAADKVSSDGFTENGWKEFAPSLPGFRDTVLRFGELERMVFVRRDFVAGSRVYRYRAQYAHTTLDIRITLAPDNRIEELHGGSE